jgi:hypothetical protein
VASEAGGRPADNETSKNMQRGRSSSGAAPDRGGGSVRSRGFAPSATAARPCTSTEKRAAPAPKTVRRPTGPAIMVGAARSFRLHTAEATACRPERSWGGDAKAHGQQNQRARV